MIRDLWLYVIYILGILVFFSRVSIYGERSEQSTLTQFRNLSKQAPSDTNGWSWERLHIHPDDDVFH